jgi:hypothetical protein
MAKMFHPRLDILPTAQLRLWRELGDVPKEFTLYGGTAIALHLGHRQSVDFDFFGSRRFNADTLQDRIPFLEAAEVLQRDANTVTYLVDRGGPVKISFFGVPGIGRVDRPLVALDIGLAVASLRDLAGTKASVVQVRSEAKDYIDVATLISHGIDLATALAAARAIYGDWFNPQNALKALVYFGDGDLPGLPAEIKRLLRDAVRAVDLDTLPVLEPVRRRTVRRSSQS